MKRMDKIFLFGLVAAICWNNLSSFSATVDNLQQEVLRLHILANSDSAEDQALKLQVRDRLLDCSAELFGDAQTREEIKAKAQASLDRMEEIAAEVISAAGKSYTAQAELTEMAFDARTYDEITMPAGVYDAVRITIGEAEGKNWWCVMYPPLCIPAAESVSTDEDTEKAYFSDAEQKILEHPARYRVRFKCVEAYHWLRKKIAKI